VSAASPALADDEAGASSELIGDALVGSSQLTHFSGSTLNTTLSSLSLIGSSELPLGGPLLSSNSEYPLPTRPVAAAEIVDTQIDASNPRLERWTIASPSMQRHISVQIMRGADPDAPAPLLYLLDGIDAPYNSGWLGPGKAGEVFAEENVTLVMPTQAAASWYSDWEQEDPALGLHRWETFLIDELDPLLTDPADPEGLNFNGHRGIGGLSMGASGAVHLANTNPTMFDGVFGISGCYSPTDHLGRQIVNIVTGSRGGDVTNMWGEFGSEEWQRHNIVSDPGGLGGMAVYLSAANGQITEADREFYGDDLANMTAGTVLERGVLSCTEDLDAAMTEAGMTHHVVSYKGPGVHGWSNFREELAPAWETIRPSLQ
jgi:diacylglycerol O-acyltransferase / trehalose O-mycolyltransferase